MNRKLISGVAIMGFAFALAACGSGSEDATPTEPTESTEAPERELNIALIHGLAADTFQINWICGAQKKAAEMGVNLKLYTQTGIDAQAQTSALSTALLENPDGLMIDAWTPGQFAVQVEDLMQQGIPVVSWNPMDPPTTWAVVNSDTHGELLAEQFVETVGDGPGTVAVLANTAGSQVEEDRWKPLIEAVQAANPEIEVAPVQYANSDVAKGTQIAGGYISAYPDLKLIVAIGGPETMAAAAAVEEQGKIGQVGVWGYNTNKANMVAMEKGIVVALGAEPSESWGALELEVLVDFLRTHTPGEAVEPSGQEFILPMKMITRENMNDPDVAPYILKDTCDLEN